ncbi:DUF4942 domain-containing protein, partial [Tyzzerella sp. OttesenSCG-928-J15]|nr:DUF4942 domain-containing protein [Tyzzerella sp. OttesenSCG-928-J15]
NKAWYINKKVILPLSAFSEWRQTCSYEPDSYRVIEKLEDIEKALNYLDAGRTDNINIKNAMAEAKENGETSKIELKFFTVTFYKKGTTHIEFTDLELLKKFNIFGCQQKKWLPPSYGKASYSTMSKAEKTVIDSFEGKEEYEKVYINPDFYLFSASQIPLLEMNAG